MSDKSIKQRTDIDKKYKWNIEDMFPDDDLVEKELSEAVAMAEKFAGYRGKITADSKTLLKALKDKDTIWLKLEKAYVYSRMRRDEDNRISKYQALTDKCQAAVSRAAAFMSYFTPELLSSSDEKLLEFINEEPDLEIYKFYIMDLLREKKHVLSPEQENLMAQLSEVTGSTNDIFTMLNNADLTFGYIKDEDGDKVQLTHGNYIKFMESHDRSVRKDAFDHMYKAYRDLINTVSTTYNYNTKNDVVNARIRKYDSARQAALSGDNIPGEVYDNLVKTVNDYLPVLHEYLDLRKEMLGVDQLHMYDVYVPLVKLPKKKVSYEEAINIMKKGLAPLGDDYISRLSKGIDAGWIDVYENQGKTSGAYSFGSYDSMPYILLNYTDTLKDVFTIVHEMGHSMHSDYTREAQPFIYGSHSIFTAEVASTVNESLLMRYLLDKETDKDMRKYLLNMYIEEFRTTLFRQTMFAEFEDMTHKAVESGEVLTAETMCESYGKLNAKYFGVNVVNDENISYEWARIPHFYNAFYVYKYATGYSAATAISQKILSEGEEARKNYIEFLKTGESDYPIELLKLAGVDMSTKEPVEKAMDTFKGLIEELKKLV